MRLLFDEAIEYYTSTSGKLGVNDKIIAFKSFEKEGVKIQNGDESSLTNDEHDIC